jgi:hypothetical protein
MPKMALVFASPSIVAAHYFAHMLFFFVCSSKQSPAINAARKPYAGVQSSIEDITLDHLTSRSGSIQSFLLYLSCIFLVRVSIRLNCAKPRKDAIARRGTYAIHRVCREKSDPIAAAEDALPSAGHPMREVWETRWHTEYPVEEGEAAKRRFAKN